MCFKIKDFYIYINFSAVAFLALIVISNFHSGFVMSFLGILLHECGHLFAMFLCNIKAKGIKISAFDIKIISNKANNIEFSKDIIITSFGIVFNFIIFLVCLPFYRTFAYINLFIGIFNLLPIGNLDGGQLLFILLTRKISADLSAKIIDVVTIIISFPLFLIGILVLYITKYNFSLLFISIYLILSLFFKKDKVY